MKQQRVSAKNKMTGAFVAALKKALADSYSQRSLSTFEEVCSAFGPFGNGSWSAQLKERLLKLALPSAATGFELRDLRTAITCLHFQRAIGSIQVDIETLEQIAENMPGGSRLVAPTDPAWSEIVSLGRALRLASTYHFRDPFNKARVEAATRLLARGFVIRVTDSGVDPNSSIFQDATAKIVDGMQLIGCVVALGRLWKLATLSFPYAHHQYLFARTTAVGPTVNPGVPFGFLLNLAVKGGQSDHNLCENDIDRVWEDCLQLATDLCALLGVEEVGPFWFMNASPKAMVAILIEIGVYDHLFAIRQWDLAITADLLNDFFAPWDASLKAKHGWGVSDATDLAKALTRLVAKNPAVITKDQLVKAGVRSDSLGALLHSFAHAEGKVNASYDSPLAAKSCDLFFKPLVPVPSGYLIPSASVAGPACYEALATAVRLAAPKKGSDIAGEGTERAVKALLDRHKLPITFAAAKYNQLKADAGECDFVLEDDQNILFIECKAKALTRATMAADPVSVLFDYAESVIASQLQAMRHQRLLIANGAIDFEDGSKLEHNGRTISRLTVTLLDLGSLQDRELFWHLFQALLRTEKITLAQPPNDPKRLNQLNDALNDLRDEVTLLANHQVDLRTWVWETSALGYGQLATVLAGTQDLADLVKKLRNRVVTGTLNPLFAALGPHTNSR